MSISQTPETLLREAYQQSLRVPVRQAASLLRDVLTPRVVAYTVGVSSAKTINRWADGTTQPLQEDHEQRLRVAYEIVELLTQFDSSETIRRWFVGSNPQLDDEAPATALREGKFGGVRSAARAFVAGG